MDDYSISSLTDSKNEWCARLVSILTNTIIQGIKSIFNEANKLCIENNENNKYLMTFQNLLSQIPNWNPSTIEQERKRIEQVSGCNYLEELITCVHIIQLKALTCIRVGQKQKKIDIDIPSLDKFIHQVYINTARKLYTNIYLFEKDIMPLQVQRNNRELETLIKEAILIAIRENIPVERILHAYMDETEEEEVIEKHKANETDISNNNLSTNQKLSSNTHTSNNLKETVEPELSIDEKLDIVADNISKNNTENDTENDIENNIENNTENNTENNNVIFSNQDFIVESSGAEHFVKAPKDLETLEKIAAINKEKLANEDDDNIKLDIGNDIEINMDTINLSNALELDSNPILNDIEIL
jgi:hypothetical protein